MTGTKNCNGGGDGDQSGSDKSGPGEHVAVASR
jgi:hypothetical protein